MSARRARRPDLSLPTVGATGPAPAVGDRVARLRPGRPLSARDRRDGTAEVVHVRTETWGARRTTVTVRRDQTAKRYFRDDMDRLTDWPFDHVHVAKRAVLARRVDERSEGTP